MVNVAESYNKKDGKIFVCYFKCPWINSHQDHFFVLFKYSNFELFKKRIKNTHGIYKKMKTNSHHLKKKNFKRNVE